jgi:hypothetical protein
LVDHSHRNRTAAKFGGKKEREKNLWDFGACGAIDEIGKRERFGIKIFFWQM